MKKCALWLSMIKVKTVLVILLIACFCFNCKKEISDNPIAGEYEIIAIENNLGGVVMERPLDDYCDANFYEDFWFNMDDAGHSGSYIIYENYRCEFNVEFTFNDNLEGERLKWRKKTKRLLSRVDRYELDDDILYLKSEAQRIKFKRK